jgi:hypothetical protein
MTKFILNSYELSYSQRCTDLKLLPLCFKREINDLLFFFKCLHGSVKVDFSTEFAFLASPRSLRSASDELLSAQPVRTECFKASYFNRIVRLWNLLPVSIRRCESFTTFKKHVNSFYVDKFASFNVDNNCTWTSTCRCQGFLSLLNSFHCLLSCCRHIQRLCLFCRALACFIVKFACMKFL